MRHLFSFPWGSLQEAPALPVRLLAVTLVLEQEATTVGQAVMQVAIARPALPLPKNAAPGLAYKVYVSLTPANYLFQFLENAKPATHL